MTYGKYEIKALKVVKQMSQETMCFTCDLYVDGKKFANISNTGDGGCHKVMPYPPFKWSDVEAVEAEMANDQFLVQSQYEKFESAVDRLIELVDTEKQISKTMKTKVCIILEDQVQLIGYKGKNIPVDQKLIDRVKRDYPGVPVLNELPIKEAVIQIVKQNDIQLELQRQEYMPTAPKGI